MSTEFDKLAWNQACETMAEQANNSCGLGYEIYERSFSGAVNQALNSLPEAHRPEAIEIAKRLGWATAGELAQSQRLMDEAGCCAHGIDPDCCPMGCGDIE
ncbi:hypothetical protein OEJ37_34810 [Burkholderia sp. BKH01]|uniref:hypothetical protein n=1 Tax=Burkholderia sp. BKH01 TaxID=2769262 RepID=UPI0021E0007F|nr:hypothetical protein [Burkholderia sp. BKH01]MCU9958533.1 hypothetical protein [Burkholderia sp. BKH01]